MTQNPTKKLIVSNTLRWGSVAAAAPYDPTLFSNEGTLYRTGNDYNQMQRAAMKQQGHRLEGITLNPEQAQTLVWLLDQVAIPHNLRGTEIYIPFMLQWKSSYEKRGQNTQQKNLPILAGRHGTNIQITKLT